MRFGGFATSLALALIGLAWLAAPGAAQDQPARPGAAAAAPATPSGPTSPVTSPSAPPPVAAPRPDAGGSEESPPGVPNESSTQTLDVPSRPTAFLAGHAKWDDGFAAIKNSLAAIKAEMDKAGLKPAGAPFTVFTETDDMGFSYQAMVPLAARPAGKDELSPDVKLGSSPSGKAIKFQHRGPYDDIDSTYDLITAYLDEKGLEARDFFIEEYLTQLTGAEDPNLAVDIYVFIK